MRFEYTGRHVEVSPAIRKHVEDHFKKLEHIFNGTTAWTHVIIEVEKNRQIGELIVHWRDHTLTAKDINADMYMALTRAIAKIEKQALKLKKKNIDRKQGARPAATVAPSPDGQLEATPRPPRESPHPSTDASGYRPRCRSAEICRVSRSVLVRISPFELMMMRLTGLIGDAPPRPIATRY